MESKWMDKMSLLDYITLHIYTAIQTNLFEQSLSLREDDVKKETIQDIRAVYTPNKTMPAKNDFFK